ncbi:unnamed protein product [Moneuplotes crassus]|uniref:Lipoprotein n=1 Tax=Euplotes crassus TaxID=5936 RepID=A0AAD1X3L5_EUPCR|nr:unnamed protein product [Moneuplotes crassus]
MMLIRTMINTVFCVMAFIKPCWSQQVLTYKFDNLDATTLDVQNEEGDSGAPIFNFPTTTSQQPIKAAQGIIIENTKHLAQSGSFEFSNSNFSMELWIFMETQINPHYIYESTVKNMTGGVGTDQYFALYSRIVYTGSKNPSLCSTISTRRYCSTRMMENGWNKFGVGVLTGNHNIYSSDYKGSGSSKVIISLSISDTSKTYIGCNTCSYGRVIIYSLRYMSDSTLGTINNPNALTNPYNGFCGDGTQQLEYLEECDDGNINDDDSCINCIVGTGYQCSGPNNVTCTKECGDGYWANTEECDDGNLDNGDGCSDECKLEDYYECEGFTLQGGGQTCNTICGDGILITKDLDQANYCDDGNTVSNDGCSSFCSIEGGWYCDHNGTNFKSSCYTTCGDGYHVPQTEGCDDENLNPGDGCDENCQIEDYYECDRISEKSVCTPICGDSYIFSGYETCDDGNSVDNDGCSQTCQRELGFSCIFTTKSICTPICGDTYKVLNSEECEDGNVIDNDGCSSSCEIEYDYSCTGSTAIAGETNLETIEICSQICGNGKVAHDANLTEICDDGNLIDGDGCDSTCKVEFGYECLLINGTSLCDHKCGDGIISSTEGCDDKNLNKGDGCDSSCQIEKDYICMNTTLNGNFLIISLAKNQLGDSVCKKCQVDSCKNCDNDDYNICDVCLQGYDKKSPNECKGYFEMNLSSSQKAMSSGAQGVSGASAGATALVSLLNLSSLSAVWSIVNQLQLFLLLLLTKTPFPDHVKSLLIGNKICTDLNYGFNILPKIPRISGWVFIEQVNPYLKTIGIDSRSALSTNLSFGIMLICLIGCYPFVICLKKFIDFDSTKKCSFNYLLLKFHDLFNFTIYIRLILGAYQLLLITSYSDILMMDFSNSSSLASFIFSIIIIAILFLTLVLSFYIFYTTRKFYDSDKFNKLREFLTGNRNSMFSRMYSFLSLTRRTLLIIWLLTFSWLDPMYLSIGMLSIQVPYFCCLVVCRPFDHPENNMIEIINETIYLVLISIMIPLHQEEDWSSVFTNIFIGLIMSNSLIITCIMITVLCMSIFSKCKNSKSKERKILPREEIEKPRTKVKTTYGIESDLSGVVMFNRAVKQKINKTNKLNEETKTNEFNRVQF